MKLLTLLLSLTALALSYDALETAKVCAAQGEQAARDEAGGISL